MSIPFVSNKTDTNDEILRRWSEFDALDERSKNILISEETINTIRSICVQHNLQRVESEEISRVVRDLFFGNIKQSDIAIEIHKRLSNLSESSAREIARVILDKIFFAKLQPKKLEQSTNITKISLYQALQKYPALGEQLVTAGPIKLKVFPSPVRPSIKNWIADYQQNLGAGRHGMMERGNYLYHSENTKRLTAEERQKLAVILKSLDEEEPVAINPEKQEVIFQPTSDKRTEELRNRRTEELKNGQEIFNKTPIRQPADQIQESPHSALSQRERGIESDTDYEMFAPQEKQFPVRQEEKTEPTEEKRGFFSKIFGHKEEEKEEPEVYVEPREESPIARGQYELSNKQYAVSNEQPTPKFEVHKLEPQQRVQEPVNEPPANRPDIPPAVKKGGPQPFRISPRRYFGNSNNIAKREPKINGNTVDLRGDR
jgi:hypothetical protein